MAVHLALYKGKGLIGNTLVRKWTLSQYSHCELVVNNVWYSSSLMDGGVRSKHITLNHEHWDLIPLPDSLESRILEYYDKTREYKYSWLDLIRSQILNRSGDEPGAAFCSEWCAAAIGIPNATSYNPGTLGDLVAWILYSKPFS